MKKNLFLAGILFLSSAAISTSCSSSDSSLDNTTSTKVKEVTITTKVANTRVSYTYNNGLVPQWETTDRLIVYRGSISSGNKSGDFTPDNITTLPESTSASFTGTLNGSGTTLNAFVQATGLSFDETTSAATVNLSSQTGTLADVKKYNLLYASINNYTESNNITMSFAYKMAVIKLDLTIPTTAGVSDLKLHTSSGLYNSVTFNADGTVKSSLSGDINLKGAVWTTNGTNQTATIYACVYPGTLNDLYIYAIDANNIVYSAKIGSKTVNAGTLYTIPSKTLATFTGSGTSGSPYEIKDEAGLRLLSYASENEIGGTTGYSGKYYRQTDNISLSGKGWEPINNFAGTYDGNSKTISGIMDMSASTNTNLGLFGNNTSAAIKGVTIGYSNNTPTTTIILPSTSSSRTTYGAIVGDAENCTISNCINYATVNGNASYMGGIVGMLNGTTTILYCRNQATLTNTSTYSKSNGTGNTDTSCNGPCVGGIVGNITNGASNTATIEACWNTSNVSCSTSNTNASAGGLVGYLNTAKISYNIIRGCYCTAASVTGYNAGGLIGCGSAKSQTTLPTATANNSMISACWSNLPSNKLSGTYNGTVAGCSSNCSYYYCIMYSSTNYIGNGTSNNTSNCKTYGSTAGKTINDWVVTNSPNLNTVWNDINSSRVYQFASSGTSATTVTITTK